MKEHLCWSPPGVRASSTPKPRPCRPAIFKAVHTASALKVAGPIGYSVSRPTAGALRERATGDLLEEFLRSDAPYRRIAVFGRSGSASRTYPLAQASIPSTKERLVIVVPKAGTSLRSILEMLIKELPPGEADPFGML